MLSGQNLIHCHRFWVFFVVFSCLFYLQGLATIPVSAFYSPEHSKEFDKYIRFCFVKVNLTFLTEVVHLKKQLPVCQSFCLLSPHRRTPRWMLQRPSWESGVRKSKLTTDVRLYPSTQILPVCLNSGVDLIQLKVHEQSIHLHLSNHWGSIFQ